MKLCLIALSMMISCDFEMRAMVSTDASDQRTSDSSQSELGLRTRVSRNRANQHNHILTSQSIRRAQTMQGSVMSSTLRGSGVARDKASRANTAAASAELGSMRHRGSNPPIIGGPTNRTSRGVSIGGTSFKRTEVLRR